MAAGINDWLDSCDWACTIQNVCFVKNSSSFFHFSPKLATNKVSLITASYLRAEVEHRDIIILYTLYSNVHLKPECFLDCRLGPTLSCLIYSPFQSPSLPTSQGIGDITQLLIFVGSQAVHLCPYICVMAGWLLL